MTGSAVDLRCPVYSYRMFARILSEGTVVQPGNVTEVSCDECRKARRKQGEQVSLVLHRFNPLGEHIETVVVPAST